MSRAWPRANRERGAALVEAALVTPLLLMILVGLVTAGLAFSRSIALQNAAREGSRFGATYPVLGDMPGYLDQVLETTRAAAIGDLDPAVTGQYICVAYVHPAGTSADDQTTRLEETAGLKMGAVVGSSCFADGRPDDEPRIQVLTRRASEINAVLFSMDVTLDASGIARFERG